MYSETKADLIEKNGSLSSVLYCTVYSLTGLGLPFKIYTARLGLAVRISQIHFFEFTFINLSLSLLYYVLYGSNRPDRQERISLSYSKVLCTPRPTQGGSNLPKTLERVSLSLLTVIIVYSKLCTP